MNLNILLPPEIWAAAFFMNPPFQRTLTGEVKHMKRNELTWSEGLKMNPIVSDSAPIVTDPNGSYTGITKDPCEKPVQDADDL